jgi:hypothetical protein
MKLAQAPDPKKLVPPYAPYRSFRNYLESLKQSIPSQIDRSVMRNMSGALQSQLAATFRYLGLVSPTGAPTDRLSRVVNSEGAERKAALQDIAKASYPFLFQGFDLRTATPKMLADRFAQMNASGGTIGKCVAFFTSLAKDAEIPLAPHLLVMRGNRIGKPRRPKAEPSSSQAASPPAGPSPAELAAMPWKQLLLSKFPSFDPTWSDEVKAKWFDGFHRLMRQGLDEKEKS